MRLYLRGHSRRYAAEQAMLSLFPDERPEYPEGRPSGSRCELTMSRGKVYTSCSCILVTDKGRYSARAAGKTPAEPGGQELSRLENRLVKLAFFRAALKSGIEKPVWGSLTGVRPVKLMSGLLAEGLSPAAAASGFRREYSVSETRTELCLDAALASESLRKSLGEKDVCLYIGIPFCPTRCSYCSFISSSVAGSTALVEPYLGKLVLEIAAAGKAVRNAGLRPVSVYVGGGTPTTLTPMQLDRLCRVLEDNFDLSSLREFTVEAGRPDTISGDKLGILRAHGVGRVSVNPQSMSDDVLEAIGRRHTAADIVRAVGDVRAAGGFALNMDLIAGLPKDSPEKFRRTLDRVISFCPENITVHTLSHKRGSGFEQMRAFLPSAGEAGEMLSCAVGTLRAHGYLPYYLYRQKFMTGGFENVGWTVPGFENIYNICMMEELCSVVAMGAGGSTKLVRGGGRIVRSISPKYPKEYIDGADRICASKSRIEDFYNGL